MFARRVFYRDSLLSRSRRLAAELWGRASPVIRRTGSWLALQDLPLDRAARTRIAALLLATLFVGALLGGLLGPVRTVTVRVPVAGKSSTKKKVKVRPVPKAKSHVPLLVTGCVVYASSVAAFVKPMFGGYSLSPVFIDAEPNGVSGRRLLVMSDDKFVVVADCKSREEFWRCLRDSKVPVTKIPWEKVKSVTAVPVP